MKFQAVDEKYKKRIDDEIRFHNPRIILPEATYIVLSEMFNRDIAIFLNALLSSYKSELEYSNGEIFSLCDFVERITDHACIAECSLQKAEKLLINMGLLDLFYFKNIPMTYKKQYRLYVQRLKNLVNIFLITKKGEKLK